MKMISFSEVCDLHFILMNKKGLFVVDNWENLSSFEVSKDPQLAYNWGNKKDINWVLENYPEILKGFKIVKITEITKRIYKIKDTP